jgi:hypothetical protein
LACCKPDVGRGHPPPPSTSRQRQKVRLYRYWSVSMPCSDNRISRGPREFDPAARRFFLRAGMQRARSALRATRQWAKLKRLMASSAPRDPAPLLLLPLPDFEWRGFPRRRE